MFRGGFTGGLFIFNCGLMILKVPTTGRIPGGVAAAERHPHTSARNIHRVPRMHCPTVANDLCADTSYR